LRILALILARGGSKRLPHKNIRLLGGRPLIVWSIDVVRDTGSVCDVLVSTDDRAIADVARGSGALVPWLRPAELATDTSQSIDACLHALDWYERHKGAVEGVVLLQPTSPFRSRESVLRGIELFRQGRRQRPVVGVSPAASHPLWCFRIVEGALVPFMDEGGLHLRSQDLPPAHVVNGAFYLAAPEHLRSRKSFFGAEMLALVMGDPPESIDIDSEWDWRLAESVLTADSRPV